jgi:hypothetical protein
VLQIHETIPLQIFDPFTELFEVGHTVSAHGSNAQIVAWVNERSVAQDVRSVVLFHIWISQTMSPIGTIRTSVDVRSSVANGVTGHSIDSPFR